MCNALDVEGGSTHHNGRLQHSPCWVSSRIEPQRRSWSSESTRNCRSFRIELQRDRSSWRSWSSETARSCGGEAGAQKRHATLAATVLVMIASTAAQGSPCPSTIPHVAPSLPFCKFAKYEGGPGASLFCALNPFCEIQVCKNKVPQLRDFSNYSTVCSYQSNCGCMPAKRSDGTSCGCSEGPEDVECMYECPDPCYPRLQCKGITTGKTPPEIGRDSSVECFCIPPPESPPCCRCREVMSLPLCTSSTTPPPTTQPPTTQPPTNFLPSPPLSILPPSHIFPIFVQNLARSCGAGKNEACKTQQISEANGGSAKFAVDGNNDTRWEGRSCTHTQDFLGGDTDPWWRVDFGRKVEVTGLRVYNRDDTIQWLQGFSVYVGNDVNDLLGNNANDVLVCAVNQDAPSSPIYADVTCAAALIGQYLYIRLKGAARILSVCEVEVYGYCCPLITTTSLPRTTPLPLPTTTPLPKRPQSTPVSLIPMPQTSPKPTLESASFASLATTPTPRNGTKAIPSRLPPLSSPPSNLNNITRKTIDKAQAVVLATQVTAAVGAVVVGVVATTVAASAAGATAAGAASGPGALAIIGQVQVLSQFGKVGAGGGALGSFSEGFAWANAELPFSFFPGGNTPTNDSNAASYNLTGLRRWLRTPRRSMLKPNPGQTVEEASHGRNCSDDTLSVEEKQKCLGCGLVNGIPLLDKATVVCGSLFAIFFFRSLLQCILTRCLKKDPIDALNFPNWEGPLLLLHWFGMLDSMTTTLGRPCQVWITISCVVIIVGPAFFVVYAVWIIHSNTKKGLMVYHPKPQIPWSKMRENVGEAKGIKHKFNAFNEWINSKRHKGEWTHCTKESKFWKFMLKDVQSKTWIYVVWILLRKCIFAGIMALTIGSANALANVVLHFVDLSAILLISPYSDNVTNLQESISSFSNFCTMIIAGLPSFLGYMPDMFGDTFIIIIALMGTAVAAVAAAVGPIIALVSISGGALSGALSGLTAGCGSGALGGLGAVGGGIVSGSFEEMLGSFREQVMESMTEVVEDAGEEDEDNYLGDDGIGSSEMAALGLAGSALGLVATRQGYGSVPQYVGTGRSARLSRDEQDYKDLAELQELAALGLRAAVPNLRAYWEPGKAGRGNFQVEASGLKSTIVTTPASRSVSFPALPQGWEKDWVSSSDRPFYVDHSTTTQWEPPSDSRSIPASGLRNVLKLPQGQGSFSAHLRLRGMEVTDVPQGMLDEAMLRTKFNFYDTNKNGLLDLHEAVLLVQDLWIEFTDGKEAKGMNLDDEHLAELAQDFIHTAYSHGNGDGQVDFNKFLLWYTAICKKHHGSYLTAVVGRQQRTERRNTR